MLLHVLVCVLAALDPTDDATALATTAPIDLSPTSAREHLWAARVAALATHTDPDVLLAIAHHESRYTDAITPESGGRVSCGPMTPTPIAHCPARSVSESYLAGARHLRAWIDARPGDYLIGYAGGYRLAEICKIDPQRRPCGFPSLIRRRAELIHRSIHRRRAQVVHKIAHSVVHNVTPALAPA